jgi:nucleoside-diphosphate-sugar epimerase
MRGCDVVCHLAEIAGPRVPVAVDEVYWGNCRAASVVMQSAMDLKLSRIIYTSSCQVYGCWEAAAAPDRLPMDETHPLRPRNAYALSKVANEAYAELVYRESGMPISIFRFPGVLIDEYLTREMIRGVMGDDGWTDGFETYVHARDAASAYVAAIEADRPGVEAYNLVADEVASGFPIRQLLIKHHPDYPRLPEDWPDFKSPVSSQKAWDQLHWKAAWNFRQHAAGIL